MKDNVFSISVILFSLLSVSICRGPIFYPCETPNCQICTYPNLCSVCSQGYLINVYDSSGAPKCEKAQCSVLNCRYCYIANQCQKCEIGYQVNVVGGCQKQIQPKTQCSNGCLTCNDTTTCQRCAYGYSLHPNKTCLKNYNYQLFNQACEVYIFSEVCQICKPNFYLSHDFSYGANGCVDGGNGKCTVSSCKKCQPGNICTQCKQGYYLNKTAQSPFCSALQCKILNCQACRGQNYCQKCRDRYELVEDGLKCTLQFPGCSVKNCDYCYDKDKCAQCQNGYFGYYNRSDFSSYCIKQHTENDKFAKNCKILDSEISNVLDGIGTSIGPVLCRQCNEGFFMLNGQCILKKNQDKYRCNVKNCKTCIYHDYCGLCEEGYKITPHSGGLCYKDYSKQLSANCKFFYSERYEEGWCSVCQSGFKNVYGKCLLQSEIKSCKVSDCQYCISENSCSMCDSGYKKSISSSTNLTICVQICQVPYCLSCLSQTKCWQCIDGYKVNSDRDRCDLIQNQNNCQEKYKNCQICISERGCIKCKPGFNWCSNGWGYCSDRPIFNLEGCAVYNYRSIDSQACGELPKCDVCEPGYVLIDGLCQSIPCTTIQNCQFCYLSKTCLVCKNGYILDSITNKCIDNSKYNNCSKNINPFCIKCDGNKCLQCNKGYTLLDNQCFCSMENCQQCIGELFCTSCYYPFVPNDRGQYLNQIKLGNKCIPISYQMSICSVPNCAACSSPIKCSLCSPGYSLNINNTCTKNACTQISNCQLCDSNTLVCHLCKPGFSLDTYIGQKCLSIPQNYSCKIDGCNLCSPTDPNLCLNCSKYYTLSSSGQCERINCKENCSTCLEPNTCISCQRYYYLNKQGQCTPTNSQYIQEGLNCSQIQHCVLCLRYYGIIFMCYECTPGYQPNRANRECVPQNCTINNCLLCSQRKNNFLEDVTFFNVCVQCNQGYYLNSISECVPISPQLPPACNVYNCMYCGYNNYCTFCVAGFLPKNGTCVRIAPCYDPNCLECPSNFPCLKCKEGYQMVEGYQYCYKSYYSNLQMLLPLQQQKQHQTVPMQTEEMKNQWKIAGIFVGVLMCLIIGYAFSRIRRQKKIEKQDQLKLQAAQTLRESLSANI